MSGCKIKMFLMALFLKLAKIHYKLQYGFFHIKFVFEHLQQSPKITRKWFFSEIQFYDIFVHTMWQMHLDRTQ